MNKMFASGQEVTFYRHSHNITSSYNAGALHLGYGDESRTYQTLFSNNGQPILDELKYLEEDYLAYTFSLKTLWTGKEIVFRYEIDDRREGRELQKIIYITPTGRLIRAE